MSLAGSQNGHMWDMSAASRVCLYDVNRAGLLHSLTLPGLGHVTVHDVSMTRNMNCITTWHSSHESASIAKKIVPISSYTLRHGFTVVS